MPILGEDYKSREATILTQEHKCQLVVMNEANHLHSNYLVGIFQLHSMLLQKCCSMFTIHEKQNKAFYFIFLGKIREVGYL